VWADTAVEKSTARTPHGGWKGESTLPSGSPILSHPFLCPPAHSMLTHLLTRPSSLTSPLPVFFFFFFASRRHGANAFNCSVYEYPVASAPVPPARPQADANALAPHLASGEMPTDDVPQNTQDLTVFVSPRPTTCQRTLPHAHLPHLSRAAFTRRSKTCSPRCRDGLQRCRTLSSGGVSASLHAPRAAAAR